MISTTINNRVMRLDTMLRVEKEALLVWLKEKFRLQELLAQADYEIQKLAANAEPPAKKH